MTLSIRRRIYYAVARNLQARFSGRTLKVSSGKNYLLQKSLTGIKKFFPVKKV